jgi:hypothetical protein
MWTIYDYPKDLSRQLRRAEVARIQRDPRAGADRHHVALALARSNERRSAARRIDAGGPL